MNKRKYQWPIYETWIVTSKPSRSFNFILGYKEVVFTLGFWGKMPIVTRRSAMRVVNNLPRSYSANMVAFTFWWLVQKQRLAAKQKASTNPSLTSLSRGKGGGGGGLIYFQPGWRGVGVYEVGDHLHPKIKSNPNSRRLTILDQSTLA